MSSVLIPSKGSLLDETVSVSSTMDSGSSITSSSSFTVGSGFEIVGSIVSVSKTVLRKVSLLNGFKSGYSWPTPT